MGGGGPPASRAADVLAVEMLLWRHAEAAAGDPDLARPLTERGRRQAERMARFLAPRLPKELRITARALGRSFETEDLIAPGAGVTDILRAAGWPSSKRPVLVVGHQPTLGEVAAQLVEGRLPGWDFGTGAVCWLKGRSRKISGGAGVLLAIEPEILERGEPAG
jgi:phosphohistidine phosphatase